MKILNFEQGSPEWHTARCGVPTASNFSKIIDADGKRSKQRTKYLYQLVGERITGKTEESYQSAAMQRGKEMEDEAIQLYELSTGETVQRVGFCVTEGKAVYGCSPDGLVGADGGSECKCPGMPNHIAYLLANKLPSEYKQQVQGNLLVTGRKWWDFISYSPGVRLLNVRVVPDLEFQSALRVELESFCEELDELVKRIG